MAASLFRPSTARTALRAGASAARTAGLAGTSFVRTKATLPDLSCMLPCVRYLRPSIPYISLGCPAVAIRYSPIRGGSLLMRDPRIWTRSPLSLDRPVLLYTRTC